MTSNFNLQMSLYFPFLIFKLDSKLDGFYFLFYFILIEERYTNSFNMFYMIQKASQGNEVLKKWLSLSVFMLGLMDGASHGEI